MSHALSRCSDRQTLMDLREILRKSTLTLDPGVRRNVRWCGLAQWYEVELYWEHCGKASAYRVVLTPADMRSVNMVRHMMHRLVTGHAAMVVDAVELRTAITREEMHMQMYPLHSDGQRTKE